ncbi:hypothetical protein NA57DRAFT_57279 [Rhizodiscina lignyota]|uniref:Uncharacterized protein n=1 Tax=Rhizodiscina lignyota TaxID=1504668 RepID=A0A9P4M5I5_9PEZI|nr:hypothetical protein NA57DRAFT_57279 [Rhizodiscina lignyota]
MLRDDTPTSTSSSDDMKRRQPRSASWASGPEKRARKKSKLSRFEQLPTELLQSIFLESVNPSLPEVSLHLVKVLSSKHICLEFCFRAFYKPLGHFRDKWMWVGERVLNSRLESPLGEEEADEKVYEAFSEERERLLKASPVERWDEFRQPAVQTRLLASRFFTWPFFLDLTRRAHPVFQKEVLWVNGTLGLREDELLRKEKRWVHTAIENVVRGVDAKPPEYQFHNVEKWYTLPWFRVKKGVSLPGKTLVPPWPWDIEMLLRWLIRSGAGRALTAGPVDVMLMPIPSGRLHDAVKLRREPIVFFFAVQARVDVTTEILRSSLSLKPFSFNITQNLLFSAHEAGADSKLDLLDPFVWKWIEEEEKRENDEYHDQSWNLRAEQCLSPARWLRKELQWLQNREPADPYFSLRNSFDNFLVELTHRKQDSPEMSELTSLGKMRRAEVRGTVLDEFLYDA